MARVSTNGVTEVAIMEIGMKTKLLDRAFICGATEEPIRDIGRITNSMERESSSGLMGKDMKVFMSKIRSKDTGFIDGQMVGFTKVCGIMGSSTEKVSSSRAKA